MKRFLDPMVEGFRDSFVLTLALIEATVGGFFRVFGRIIGAFAEHKPLPVAPGKNRQVA